MKIVDRKTFMQMPKGTVFCKFPRFNEATRSYDKYVFGITEPYIKTDDTDENSVDFYAIGIGSDLDPVASTGSDDTGDILTDMERNLGKEVPFDYCGGRDGMYEGDEVGFAIFSRKEVELMIKTLQESLATAYSQPANVSDIDCFCGTCPSFKDDDLDGIGECGLTYESRLSNASICPSRQRELENMRKEAQP